MLSVYFWAVPLLYAQAIPANSEFTLGVQAYTNAKYEESILHFKRAIELDPSCLPCHLYLGRLYADQYIPGANTPENQRAGHQALEEFSKVLTLDPNREEEITALKGTAALQFNMKNFDAAKQAHRKLAALDPNDPEPFFSMAVIDWTQCYQPRMEERAKLKLQPNETFIHSDTCWKVKAANEDKVNDGIEMLTKALSLRPDYDNAMAYMNLMYRERADIRCGDRAAYNADIRKADEWVDMTMAVKKRKAERATPNPETRQQP